jgi:hypothetical protein
MWTELGVDAKTFRNVPQFGSKLIEGRLENVCWMTGFLQWQIRGCMFKPLLGRRNYPIKIEEELVTLDRNGSYTSSYVEFDGIPVGSPTSKRMDDPAYYYILIDVKRYWCHHTDDPYPLLYGAKQYWVDKVTFDLIRKHYMLVYEEIGGYYFRKVENRLRDISLKLWDMKSEYPEVGALIKWTLNCMWGKSIRKPPKIKRRKVREVEDGDTYTVATDGTITKEERKVVYMPWGRPQFGVNVMSWSRKVMQELIYKCVDLGVDIFYVNTDSVLIRKSDLSRVPVEIGRGLGQFKIEKECVKFICLGPRKWWMRLVDGSEIHSGGQDGEEWWERAYSEQIREYARELEK